MVREPADPDVARRGTVERVGREHLGVLAANPCGTDRARSTWRRTRSSGAEAQRVPGPLLYGALAVGWRDVRGPLAAGQALAAGAALAVSTGLSGSVALAAGAGLYSR